MENLQNILNAELIQMLGWTLVHFVWQAAVIAVILAIVLKMLQKHSANLRYTIACLALALIIPLQIVTLRSIEVSVPGFDTVKLAALDLPQASEPSPVIIEMSSIDLSSSPPQTASMSTLPFKDRFIDAVESALPYIVMIWLVGVFSLSLWHLGGWMQLQKLRRQMVKDVTPTLRSKSHQLAGLMGIRKAISLMESALVQVPTVVGHFKPIILLPATALTGLSSEQIEAILAHELAHIKRNDYLFNILQTVVEILGFYHPAVWWISHKIRAERENCCDDAAVDLVQNRKEYAGALFTMEEIRAKQRNLAVAANGGHLQNRISRLIGKKTSQHQKSGWISSIAVVLALVGLIASVSTATKKDDMEAIDNQQKSTDQLTLKIVDQAGSPVAGANVGTRVDTRDTHVLSSKLQWSLRGSSKPAMPTSDENGIIKLNPADIILDQWKTEPKAVLYVMHEQRQLGALVGIYSNKPQNETTVTLKPLCHIHGKIKCDYLDEKGYPLKWTNVYLHWNKQTPSSHMSEKQDCQFWVPPGQYELFAYGFGGKDINNQIAPTRPKIWTIEVKPGQKEMNLGDINLAPTKLSTLIGKQAPEIGPIKEWKNGLPVTLEQLKGSPVLILFDGEYPSTTDFQTLTELHEQFASKGLVIIALYNCPTMEDVEKNWDTRLGLFGGAEEVPFRIAVDGGKSSFIEETNKERLGQTYGTYDINAYPTTMLIDPQGNVLGSFDTLQVKDILREMYGMAPSEELSAEETWAKAFNNIYKLEDSEVLKRIAPPFIPERKEYYYDSNPDQAKSIPEPPDYFTFHWDGELKGWGMGFMGNGNNLSNVLRSSLSIPADQFEGTDDLLGFKVPGDWIVRKNVTDQEKLIALESILRKELGKYIAFQKRTVLRNVIVAKGTFKFTSPLGTYDNRQVHFYSDKLDSNEGSGGGTADSVAELISVLGQRTGVQVIDETKNSSEKINLPYGHHRSSRLRRVKDQSEKNAKLNLMLQNLQKQTNLTFTLEERLVEKWFVVDRDKPAAVAGFGGGAGGFGGMGGPGDDMNMVIRSASSNPNTDKQQFQISTRFLSLPIDIPVVGGLEEIQQILLTNQQNSAKIITDVQADMFVKMVQGLKGVPTLACPKVTVSDNEPATMAVTKQVRIPSKNGGYEDINSGITLDITPHLSQEGLIRVEIDYKTNFVNDIEQAKISSTSLITMVAIPDGGNIAIGPIEVKKQGEPTKKLYALINVKKVQQQKTPIIHPIMYSPVIYDVKPLLDLADKVASISEGGIEYKDMIAISLLPAKIKEIAPSNWQADGDEGRINIFGSSRLVIYQTKQNHAIIAAWLKLQETVLQSEYERLELKQAKTPDEWFELRARHKAQRETSSAKQEIQEDIQQQPTKSPKGWDEIVAGRQDQTSLPPEISRLIKANLQLFMSQCQMYKLDNGKWPAALEDLTGKSKHGPYMLNRDNVFDGIRFAPQSEKDDSRNVPLYYDISLLDKYDVVAVGYKNSINEFLTTKQLEEMKYDLPFTLTKMTIKQTTNNLGQLIQAVKLYKAENHDEQPYDIQQLKPYLDSETYTWLIQNAVLLYPNNTHPNIRNLSAPVPLAYDRTLLKTRSLRAIAMTDDRIEYGINDIHKDKLDKAIHTSNRMRSMYNIKEIGPELWSWANKHNDVWPATIEEVDFEDKSLKEWALQNVKYLAPGKPFSDFNNTAKEIIAYDKTILNTHDGTNLLFADGHVEYSKKDKNGNIDLISQTEKQAELNERPQIMIQARIGLIDKNLLEELGYNCENIPEEYTSFQTENQMKLINFVNRLLDENQAETLIKALKLGTNSKTITSPTVMAYNGEPAIIKVEKERNYIADYTDPANLELTPQKKIDTLKTGLMMSVTPNITSDNKYVVLKVNFEYSKLTNSIFQYYQQAKHKKRYPYELPIIETIDIKTRVTIPDGSTVLLGGVSANYTDPDDEPQIFLMLIKATILGGED